jgi:hypothetical protein
MAVLKIGLMAVSFPFITAFDTPRPGAWRNDAWLMAGKQALHR